MILWLTGKVIFTPREALISRPEELSYEVINIQATKVRSEPVYRHFDATFLLCFVSDN